MQKNKTTFQYTSRSKKNIQCAASDILNMQLLGLNQISRWSWCRHDQTLSRFLGAFWLALSPNGLVGCFGRYGCASRIHTPLWLYGKCDSSKFRNASWLQVLFIYLFDDRGKEEMIMQSSSDFVLHAFVCTRWLAIPFSSVWSLQLIYWKGQECDSK